MVAVSAADTSVPSLTARRNEGGVTRSSPRARHRYTTTDSEAPTRVPAKDARMRAIAAWYASQSDPLVGRPAVGEVGPVGGVGPLQVRRHRSDGAVDERRVVPEVGVAARRHAHQVADVEHGPVPAVGGQQLLHPGVVAGAVEHGHLGVGEGPGVGGRRLVGVRVGLRIIDDAHHVGVDAADLGGDASPEVLGRHHPHHTARVDDRALPRRRQAGGASAQHERHDHQESRRRLGATGADRRFGDVGTGGTRPAYMGMVLITSIDGRAAPVRRAGPAPPRAPGGPPSTSSVLGPSPSPGTSRMAGRPWRAG